MRQDTRKNRGVALVWTMVTISILLIVASTMANYIIKESQMSVRIEDSTQAYTLAQSGINWAKEYVSNECGAPGWNGNNFSTSPDLNMLGGLAKITITPQTPTGGFACGTVSHGKITVTSEGKYGAVGRKLEYVISSSAPTVITPASILATTARRTAKSYSFQFDYWANPSNPVGSNVGFSNNTLTPFAAATTVKTLAVSIDSTNINLKVVDGLTVTTLPIASVTDPDLFPMTDEYSLRFKLRYLQDTAAELTLYKMDNNSGAYSCINTVTIPLIGSDLSMDSGYFVAGGGFAMVTTVGDGKVLAVFGGYTDNFVTKGIGVGVDSGTYPLATSVSPAGYGFVGGGSDYPPGAIATIRAEAYPGFLFSNWSGSPECNGRTDLTVSITMNGPKSCTANFYMNGYMLNITTNNPNGINITGARVYPYGETAHPTVSINSGYTFNGWGGDCSYGGSATSINVYMNSTKNCTANVTLIPVCNVSAWPVGPASYSSLTDGSTLDGAASSYRFPDCQYNPVWVQIRYKLDGDPSWTTSGIVQGAPSVSMSLGLHGLLPFGTYKWSVLGSEHSNMSGAIVSEERTFYFYSTNFTLTTAVSPPGAATISPAAGQHSYSQGSSPTVSWSNAQAGYVFDGWSGGNCADRNTNPTWATMSSDQSCTANFHIPSAGEPPVISNVSTDANSSSATITFTSSGSADLTYSVAGSDYIPMSSGQYVTADLGSPGPVQDNGDDTCSVFYNYTLYVQNSVGQDSRSGSAEYRGQCSEMVF